DLDVVDALRLLRRIDGRRDARERARRGDPQAPGKAMLARELPREAPRDARIAEVVDDLAKEVPARGHGRSRRVRMRRDAIIAPAAFGTPPGHNRAYLVPRPY